MRRFRQPLGINFEHVSYYGGSQPWLNLLRYASDWIGHKQTAQFNFDYGPVPTPPDNAVGPDLLLDADGNPTALNPDQGVQCALKISNSGRLAYNTPGNYLVLLYTGTGTFTITGGGATYSLISNDTASNPKRAVISLSAPANTSSPYFRFSVINAGDPIKVWDPNGSLGLVEQKYEAAYRAGQRWHPNFLRLIAPFDVLRFLNWGVANDSPQVDWADRRPRNWMSQRSQGGWTNSDRVPPLPMVSYEEMIDLCNLTGKSPHFTIPHAATDDYVTELAELVRDTLDPDLPARFENSNEVWNNIFGQYNFSRDAGLVIWPEQAATPWVATRQWHAKRTVEMMDVLDSVFTGEHARRLIKVAAWQHGDPANGALLLDFTDANVPVPVKAAIDEVHVGYYIAGDLGNNPQAATTAQPPYNKTTVSMNPYELIYWMRHGARGLGHALKTYTRPWAKIAHDRGLKLGCYEAGTHLTNGPGLTGNSTLTALFTAAHARREMADLVYDTLVGAAEVIRGEAPISWLSETYIPSATGHWGLLPHQNSPPAPRLEGLLRFAREYSGFKG